MSRRGKSHPWKRGAIALGLIAVVTGGPTLVLDRAALDSAECFAAIERRADDALPECRRDIYWLEELPFIGRAAQLDREEMEARQAAMGYLDAALGAPDRALRAQRFEALEPALRMLERGSGQLRLDRLGAPLAAPMPELYATVVDDRDALRAGAARFTRQAAQRRALSALLLEEGLEPAAAVASRYLEAADDDVRLRAAALRCAVGDAAGMEVALAVERDRAENRTEAFSRAFGGARIVVEACGETVEENAPGPPPHGGAGTWDQRARFMAMRLRQLRSRECEPDGSCAAALGENLVHLRELLDGGFEVEHRLALVALMHEVVDAEAARKWFPEPVPVPRFADELLARRGAEPFLPAERWQAAAKRFEALGFPSVGAAMRAWAAGGFAQRGDLAQADAVLAALPDRARAAELRVAVALVAGRLSEARTRAADLAEDGVGHLLRAQLALPDRVRALAHVEAALASIDPEAEERARWLGAALVEPAPRGGEIAWVAGTTGSIRRARLEALWAAFASARAAPASERRAFRYRLFREHRGDAPRARAAWLFLLGTLVDGEGTEPFLDAMHAVDVGALTARQHALVRWLAASWRGDEAAAIWQERLVAANLLAQDTKRRDLLQTLDL